MILIGALHHDAAIASVIRLCRVSYSLCQVVVYNLYVLKYKIVIPWSRIDAAPAYSFVMHYIQLKSV
jgi:hypothetical protein